MKRTAISDIALQTWRADPVRFVVDTFHVEPDRWQADALRMYATQPRLALVACKGPGKSALLAWCGWWNLATFVDAQGIAVSITGDNLRDNLWKELAVWRQSSEWLKQAFDHNAERITSKVHPKTWWLSARSFPQNADKTQQANTLAGMHAKVVFVLLDEVGDYPEGVVVAAEGIFAVSGVEQAHLIVAGNPTSQKGPLFRISTRDASRWGPPIHITGDPDDPKRSSRISLEWAREQITLWGPDSPWVQVNVLGQFPDQATNKLIGINDVLKAQERDAPVLAYRIDARIWGLDPGRSLYGDPSCLCRRQGLVCFRFNLWRGLDGPQLANKIGQALLESEKAGQLPDAVFVDVGGVGSSAYDHLRLLGWQHLIHGVDFGGGADKDCFANKRAEMWWNMAQWLKKSPACLPTDPDLSGELTEPEMDYRVVNKRTAFVLESKEQMHTRGVKSPNKADALCLTFAAPVAPRAKAVEMAAAGTNKATSDYDSYERANRDHQKAASQYDPLQPRY